MSLDLDADLIGSVAARYGVDPGDASAVAAAVERARRLADRLDPDAGSGEEDRPSEVPVLGTDEDLHGAFRTRFRFAGESPAGPLSDLSVAVKDNVAVAGVEMTCGSRAFSYQPPRHATVVARLRSAGAAVVGTTEMDEFAYHTTGETCAHGRVENPVAEGRIPGGSSAGSAAAVAAGEVDAALGTDTGGSIRIPASFCGVVGLKPTYGSVSRFGVAPLAPSLDHVGPLAGSVETAARVWAATLGPDPRDPATVASRPAGGLDALDGDPGELRVGLVAESFERAGDPVERRVRAAVDRLEARGVGVEAVSVPGLEDAPAAVAMLVGAEFSTLLAAGGRTYAGAGQPEGFAPAVREATADGDFGEDLREQLLTHGVLTEATGGDAYARAQSFRRSFSTRVAALFEDVDALVTPTTPVTAPAFGDVDDGSSQLATMADAAPFDLTGHPALSVPCGEVDGRPVGLQVVADYCGEPTALRLGRAVERS